MDANARLHGIQRSLGLFGLGSFVALASALTLEARSPVARPPGPVELWATDRDAHAVVGLDRDLVRARTVELGWPIEVEARADGGCWVVRSAAGQPIGEHRLVRLSAAGDVVAEAVLGTFLDLAAMDDRDALVVELGGGAQGADRALRVDETGAIRAAVEEPGLVCIAGQRDVVLLGTSAGAVRSFGTSAGAVFLAEALLSGEIGDVAPGPRSGTWWALDVAGGGKLHLLEADLSIAWSAPVGLRSLHVIPVEGAERVWIADTTEPIVRRFGPGGAIEIDRLGLRLTGADRGSSWHDGGVLLAAPGGVLHLDAQGRSAPGQGGFQFLIDVDRVP